LAGPRASASLRRGDLRVAVVGAGDAGTAAATEASRAGASVTIFDACQPSSAPKALWPTLLTDPRGMPHEVRFPDPESVHVATDAKVVGVDGGSVHTARGRIRFDAVVLSTGSVASWRRVGGVSKPGVFVLDSEAAFRRLAACRSASDRWAVWGSGPLAALVAERLSEESGVLAFAPGGPFSSYLGDGASARLALAAAGSGHEVVPLAPERVVGEGKVEAVVAAGRVFPCDALVVVPSWLPSPLPSSASLGLAGGVAVDSEMSSSICGLFAAGDCAEVRLGTTTTPLPFRQAAVTMGSVAGRNAAGLRTAVDVLQSYATVAYGAEVGFCGLTLALARRAGFDAVEHCADGDPFCTVVARRPDSRVLGLQSIGPGSERAVAKASAMVSSGCRLEDLAYPGAGSNDISAFVDAAREAMTGI
jgi:D-hydroxyproline dehydrogenase subunit alpha